MTDNTNGIKKTATTTATDDAAAKRAAAILDIPANASDGRKLKGVALLRDVSVATDKNGKTYARGRIVTRKATWPFKKWGVTELKSGIYELTGEWSTFGGGQVAVDTLTAVSPERGYAKADFLPQVYDAPQLARQLEEELKAAVSENGIRLFTLLMDGPDGAGDSYRARFVAEFAAKSHHDNVPSGLLAHSLKVMRILISLFDDPIRGYRDLGQDVRDITIVGGVLHDLGKVLEYDDGEMADASKFISHREFGVMRAQSVRPQIEAMYGRDGFYRLVSIFSQHHGQWGERPKTVEAFLVHEADDFDARVTELDQKLKACRDQGLPMNDVKLDDWYLNV